MNQSRSKLDRYLIPTWSVLNTRMSTGRVLLRSDSNLTWVVLELYLIIVQDCKFVNLINLRLYLSRALGADWYLTRKAPGCETEKPAVIVHTFSHTWCHRVQWCWWSAWWRKCRFERAPTGTHSLIHSHSHSLPHHLTHSFTQAREPRTNSRD